MNPSSSPPPPKSDSRLSTPLAELHGSRPPAPGWFASAMADRPERSRVEVEGAAIELLTWGERGRPGLLLAHGGMAHADWWSGLAPFFARTHRVAALSFSGCGGSQWRARYAVPQFAREMDACARAGGLWDVGAPVYAAHSFGTHPLLHAASRPELRPRAAIVLDNAVSPPASPSQEAGGPPGEVRPHRVYPDLESALARFRLLPEQPCANLFMLDQIARDSLQPVGSDGWSWRFDPALFARMEGAGRAEMERAVRGALCPLAFLYAEQSKVVRPESLAYTRAAAPAGALFVALPQADHHLFLDQPLATVGVLRALLAVL